MTVKPEQPLEAAVREVVGWALDMEDLRYIADFYRVDWRELNKTANVRLSERSIYNKPPSEHQVENENKT